jgi:nucleotide-binding universal stress UspA family protein
VIKDCAEAAKRSLDEWIERFAEQNVVLDGTVVEGGLPHEVIQTVAEKVGAQLIVIGTHGL